MTNIHERTQLLVGQSIHDQLINRNILIAGLGGVGSFATEAIARAGIQNLTLVDHDLVDPSNINRQLIALHSTTGLSKTAVMSARITDIDPKIRLNIVDEFITPDNVGSLLQDKPYDYIVDCIDSIACKAALVVTAQNLGVPVISAMGAGGRLDVSKVIISTLKKTHTCPLAREMRKKVRLLSGDLKYPVVFSTEIPKKGSPHQPVSLNGREARPRSVNGTISYLPGLFGLMIAGHVVQNLLNEA